MATITPYAPPSLNTAKTRVASSSRYGDTDALIEARADLATARIAREITAAITKGTELGTERLNYLEALLAKAGS